MRRLTFARDGSAQLSERDGTSPRENTTNKPNDERAAGRWNIRVDGTWRGEDAASDDYADDDAECLERAEVLPESTLLSLDWYVGVLVATR
jgi:hypothetical protein